MRRTISSNCQSRFLTLLSNMFTNLNLTDVQTGYKAFTASTIKPVQIEEDRFGVESELVAKIAKLRCRIFEVGISYYGRTYRRRQEDRLARWLPSVVRHHQIWLPAIKHAHDTDKLTAF